MFRFNFDVDSSEDLASPEPTESEPNPIKTEPEPFSEIPLIQLLGDLPSLISYSPLPVPLASARKSITLARRDLFDARFQLISEGAGDPVEGEPNAVASNHVSKKSPLDFLDAPSDLVPGVYEGGLKTWECSLDLVDYLDGQKDLSSYDGFCGKSILELGCGTAVPSSYIFHELLDQLQSSEKPDPPTNTHIHLQDYNPSVLQLVTLPNLLLVWYASPLANPYRSSINDPEIAPLIDPSTPGELPITPDLKSSFISFLDTHRITLRFFAGSWDAFDPSNTTSPSYDILLTSETIYQTSSLDALLTVLERATKRNSGLSESQSVCLVAAKVLYFGVGGGVSDFLQAVENRGGKVKTVLERRAGVGRKIMSVHW